MKNRRRLARCLVYPVLLLAGVPGCQAFHVYRPVTVLARDAETKQPIPGAEIHLSYPTAQSPGSPWEPVGVTGSDGTVQLKAAPYGEAGILLDASKSGYMSELKGYSTEAVEAVPPAFPFGPGGTRPVSFVVEMYAGPTPAVELVLPPGFRGEVRATVQIQEDAPRTPGQRLFSYPVAASGAVQVSGPPLLRRVTTPDFVARYANGISALSRQAKDGEVGFWCVRTEGAVEYFLVGTRAEYEALLRAEADDGKPAKSSGGKGGKGGGKRGGRGGGGQSSSDSGSGGTGQ
jgi:hypothetical protein